MKKHRKIAFYLPQFHEIPENNEFWGDGFTEWTNVRRAKPQYKGHQQPLRLLNGYYNLTDPAVHTYQSKLALESGIDAFCFYTYWFSGRQLMRKVIDLAVENHVEGFKFCLCWANETWSRRWDGQEHEILIKQNHDSVKDADYIDDHLDLLQHKNYLRVDGRPILIIYRSDILDKPAETIKNLRIRARSLGLGELFIVMAQTFGVTDPRKSGFDAAVEFPPHTLSAVSDQTALRNKDFKGDIYDYRSAVINNCRKPIEPYLVLPTVMPGWDNTPRRMRDSTIFSNQSIEAFKFWIQHKIKSLESLEISAEKKLLFVNAWNEWAEGSQIEPDASSYKMERLNALRGEKKLISKHGTFENFNADRNYISLVLPIFATNEILKHTILSIRDQVDQFDEIVIVDDNPNIESREEFIRNLLSVDIRMNYIKNQTNLGSASSLNLGIENANGKTIVLCNDDDLFEPTRVHKIRNYVRSLTSESYWGYSSVECIDQFGDVINLEKLPIFLAEAISENNKKGCSLSSMRYTNPIISTGNLFMAKNMWERVGKFNSNLTHVHDWEFATKLKVLSDPIYLEDEKYYYRIHSQNSFKKIPKSNSRSQIDQLHISCEEFLWSFGSLENICEYFLDMIIQPTESVKHGKVELVMLEIRVLRLFNFFLKRIRKNGPVLRLCRYVFDKIELFLLRI